LLASFALEVEEKKVSQDEISRAAVRTALPSKLENDRNFASLTKESQSDVVSRATRAAFGGRPKFVSIDEATQAAAEIALQTAAHRAQQQAAALRRNG
jgi:uncharacterized protein (DUF2126 family)